MGENSFCLRTFIEAYVNSAFGQFDTGALSKIPLDSFENRIREEVSQKLEVSSDFVLSLHHPFHWSFFCVNGCSPFEYVQPIVPGEPLYVRLRPGQEHSNLGKREIIAYIDEKYSTLLEERVKKAKRLSVI